MAAPLLSARWLDSFEHLLLHQVPSAITVCILRMYDLFLRYRFICNHHQNVPCARSPASTDNRIRVEVNLWHKTLFLFLTLHPWPYDAIDYSHK